METKSYRTSYEQVSEFMSVMEQSTPIVPAWPDEATFRLRVRVILEEHWETMRAMFAGDSIEILDGLCDMDYVNTGTAIAFGISYPLAFDEVHRSNMSKVDPVTGKPNKDEGGKVIKPPTYSKASLSQFLGSMPSCPPPYDTKAIVQEQLQNVFKDPKNRYLLDGLALPTGYFEEDGTLTLRKGNDQGVFVHTSNSAAIVAQTSIPHIRV